MADAWARLLCDRSAELSALFRYMICLILDNDRFLRIAERYQEEALLQYQRNSRAYDKVWRTYWQPPNFAEWANAFYEQTIAQQP
jgi:hypothetical protein